LVGQRNADIEIDAVMRQEDELSVFECKWTNKKFDKKTVDLLVSKAARLKPDTLGFFSKAGYVKGLDPIHLYYTLDDLYGLTVSK
jgi:hypothetical protein